MHKKFGEELIACFSSISHGPHITPNNNGGHTDTQQGELISPLTKIGGGYVDRQQGDFMILIFFQSKKRKLKDCANSYGCEVLGHLFIGAFESKTSLCLGCAP
jgi:hypothetical protein